MLFHLLHFHLTIPSLFHLRLKTYLLTYDDQQFGICSHIAATIHITRPYITSGENSTSISFRLKITDRLFLCASPYFWNELSHSFRQPHHFSDQSPPHLTSFSRCYFIFCIFTSLYLTIPSLFHLRLKTYLLHKSFPP